MPTITLPSPVGSIEWNGYLVEPVRVSGSPDKWPAVVMIHDIFGMTDDIREHADGLAAAGYLTVVPDLYRGRGMIRCVQGAFRQLFARQGQIFEYIDADRLRPVLEKSGVAHEVKEYPQARHGFMNRLAVASPLSPLMKVAGIGYDHAATADAKRRILGFFDTHLQPPT